MALTLIEDEEDGSSRRRGSRRNRVVVRIDFVRVDFSDLAAGRAMRSIVLSIISLKVCQSPFKLAVLCNAGLDANPVAI